MSDPADLEESLARECHLRLHTAREHLELSDTVEAQRAELERLHDALRDSLTTNHALNTTTTELRAELVARHADLEHFIRLLESAQNDAARAETAFWRADPVLRAVRRWRKPAPPPATPAAAPALPSLTARYHFYTSPYRLFREPSFTFRGWVRLDDNRPVLAVRSTLDGQAHLATTGLADAEAGGLYGFTVTVPLTPGHHTLAFDAQLADSAAWATFLALPLWAT